MNFEEWMKENGYVYCTRGRENFKTFRLFAKMAKAILERDV